MTPQEGGGIRWTLEEKVTFANKWKRGEAIKQIAFDLGKSINAVKKQRVAMKLPPRRTGDKDHQLRINVNDKDWEAMKKRASARRQTTSDYIRHLIRIDIGVAT